MTAVEVGEPRTIDAGPLRLAGLSGEYTQATTVDIPKQWDRLNVGLDQAGYLGITYGVIYPGWPMRYVCAVESSRLAQVPDGWLEADLPAQRYAAFAYVGGVDTIRRAWPGIYTHWVPQHKNELSDAPMVEFYGERFGAGDDRFEIWLPLKRT